MAEIAGGGATADALGGVLAAERDEQPAAAQTTQHPTSDRNSHQLEHTIGLYFASYNPKSM